MSGYADITVTLDKFVATVEIQRPPHNFFDYSLIGQIADAFDALDQDANCRAIILAANGKSFCAGANFGTGQSDGSGSQDFTEEGFRNTTGKLYREAARLFATRNPLSGPSMARPSAVVLAWLWCRISGLLQLKHGLARTS